MGETVVTGTEAERRISDPSMLVLRGAGLPAAGAVLLTAGCLSLTGGRAASVIFGGVMALLVLAVSPLLQCFTRRMDPVAVLGIGVLAYACVLVLVIYAYTSVHDMSWVRVTPVAAGGLLAILGWCAGHLWMKQRTAI